MENLKFYIVTFNCARTLIELDSFANHLLDGWEDPNTHGHGLPDVIVLTLQEFAPLSYAFLGGGWVKPYFDRFRQAVSMALEDYNGKHDMEAGEFVNVIAQNSGLTAITIFAKKTLLPAISELRIADVGVGVWEMANKGAIGARIGWDLNHDGKPFFTTFVSAHLAPFEADVHLRDQNYVDIVKGLVFAKQDAREWRKEPGSDENVPLLGTESADTASDSTKHPGMYSNDGYLFFSGDLNYRTALTGPGGEDPRTFPRPKQDPDSALHYRQLLDKDQLQQQLAQGKTLHGLTEQPINFLPTYKYHTIGLKPVIKDDDVSEWNWSQHRWPSWCDRVLFSRTASLPVKAGRYSALPIFRTSDHRPVALSVSVPVKPVIDSNFSAEAPTSIDRQCHQHRLSARRREVAVGVAAYLALTWEGNYILLATVLVVVGSVIMFR